MERSHELEKEPLKVALPLQLDMRCCRKIFIFLVAYFNVLFPSLFIFSNMGAVDEIIPSLW